MRTHVIDSVISVARYWYVCTCVCVCVCVCARAQVLACTWFFRIEKAQFFILLGF